MFCIFSSKSGDSSWNVWWVIVLTSKSWQTHRYTHTHTGDDNTRRPKGPRVKTTNKMLQSSFTTFAHVFLTISGRFCVKHMSKSSACQTLVRTNTDPQTRGLTLRRRPPYWNRRPTPTLLRKKCWVRFMPRFIFPIVGMYILNNI